MYMLLRTFYVLTTYLETRDSDTVCVYSSYLVFIVKKQTTTLCIFTWTNNALIIVYLIS